MKKIAIFIAILITGFAMTSIAADGIALSSQVPLKFYGFISAEAMWSDSQLATFGTDNSNTAANYNRSPTGLVRVIDESTSPNDAFITATVQNTRFGLVLDPYKLGENGTLKVDARLEMDFFSPTNTNPYSVVPRIRRAYGGIGQERWHLLAGNEWDLYSPLNVSMLDLGGNLWLQGNQGYRRPQVRFLYKYAVDDKSGLEGAISVNLPSSSLAFNDSANTTSIPMFEWSWGYWRQLPTDKMKAYLTALYARHHNETAGASDVNNWGLALSVDLPIHPYLKLSGEFQYGYSLGTLLMLSNSKDTLRQRSISGWGQIKSSWLSWLETNIGYGADTVKASQVASGWVKNNQTGFINVQFKLYKRFIVGLEYSHKRTSYKGFGTSKANLILSNLMVNL